jgi:hypothetical protein
MVAQRQSLLAWTGHSLSVSPTINGKMVRRLGNYSGVYKKLTVEELGALG